MVALIKRTQELRTNALAQRVSIPNQLGQPIVADRGERQREDEVEDYDEEKDVSNCDIRNASQHANKRQSKDC